MFNPIFSLNSQFLYFFISISTLKKVPFIKIYYFLFLILSRASKVQTEIWFCLTLTRL